MNSDIAVTGWGQHEIPVGLTNIVALAAGATHSLVIRTNAHSLLICRQPVDAVVPPGFPARFHVLALSDAAPMRYHTISH